MAAYFDSRAANLKRTFGLIRNLVRTDKFIFRWISGGNSDNTSLTTSHLGRATVKAKRQRRVAIISTGDELVQGRTIDTNAAYIADRLGAIGIEAQSVVTVGDYPEQIEWAWHHSLARADIVIATGGLGPTADDRTTETLAHVADAELYLDEEQAQRIKRFFEVLRRPMPENNLKQARFPVGADIIPNELGTAPGYRLAVPQGHRRPIAVVLPGVPREMKAMLDTQVVPWILSQSENDRSIVARTFQTFGMSESALDEALVGAIDPDAARLSFRASFPQVSVRIAVIGKQSEAGIIAVSAGDPQHQVPT